LRGGIADPTRLQLKSVEKTRNDDRRPSAMTRQKDDIFINVERVKLNGHSSTST
jgi:hypothetical protein